GAYPHNTWEDDTAGDVSGAITLSPVRIPDADVVADMVLVPATDDLPMGLENSHTAPRHHRRVPAFYLDPTEFTVEKAFEKRPKPENWTNPDDFPITDISWDEAVAYAESVGKRLMEEAEYEAAATAGGRLSFPWGE